MPNLLLRNLEDDVLERLKTAAKTNGRSLQSEIHETLRLASTRNLASTRRLSAKWLRRLQGTPHTDSTVLIRQGRGRR